MQVNPYALPQSQKQPRAFDLHSEEDSLMIMPSVNWQDNSQMSKWESRTQSANLVSQTQQSNASNRSPGRIINLRTHDLAKAEGLGPHQESKTD